MKKITLILALVLISFSYSSAFAAGTKVAYVEVKRLLKESPQVKAINDRIRREFAKREDQLIAEQKRLNKLIQKLERDGATMSESERKRLERDIITRKRKFKNAQSEFQEDLAIRQNEEVAKLRKVIAEKITKVAKKYGYDMVLETGVVWASDRVDITDKVLKELKRR